MKKLTMTNICRGAVQEKIDRALKEVGSNILDPNKDPEKKRSITLKITFKPSKDDREDVLITADVSMQLAPDEPVKSQLYISKDLKTGAMTIQEHARGEIKSQLSFGDVEDLRAAMETPEEDTEEDTDKHEKAVGDVLDFRKR